MRRTRSLVGMSAAALLACTVSSPAGAIFNGTQADADTNPSMAYVTQPDLGISCGGVLVSPTQVLTAGHCATNESGAPLSGLVVGLDVIDLGELGPENLHTVVDVDVHPSYDPAQWPSFDLAVLTLDAAVDTPVARVVGASEDELWAPGTMGTLTGWGLTSNGGSPPADLRVGEVPIRDDQSCPFTGPPGTLFCAGADAGTATQACSGDSGGALLVRDAEDEPVVVGIAVASDGQCGGEGFPDGYARVGDEPLNSWLAQQIVSPGDTTAPRVVKSAPTGKGVERSANVSVTFDEQVDPSTVTRRTFLLQRMTPDGAKKVGGSVVTLKGDGVTARLDPFGAGHEKLARGTKYRVTVTTKVRDLAGNRLDQSAAEAGLQQKTWTFRTVR